jgi:hypothetical protein
MSYEKQQYEKNYEKTQGQEKERKYDFAKKSGSGPLKRFQSGAISVTIWENENLSPEGQVQSYKSVSFERRYKDKNGEWKSTNSLRVNDLPKASLILSKAYEYLVLTGEDHDETPAY